MFQVPKVDAPKANTPNAGRPDLGRPGTPNNPLANPSANGILPGEKPVGALSNLPPAPAANKGVNRQPSAEIARDFERAVAAQKAGNTAEALKWYRAVLQKQPQALEARTNMAILFAQNKQPAKAIEQLEAARKLSPENPAINQLATGAIANRFETARQSTFSFAHCLEKPIRKTCPRTFCKRKF